MNPAHLVGIACAVLALWDHELKFRAQQLRVAGRLSSPSPPPRSVLPAYHLGSWRHISS